jgi:hypothetical protein
MIDSVGFVVQGLSVGPEIARFLVKSGGNGRLTVGHQRISSKLRDRGRIPCNEK